jgi:hypothetical protein
MDGLSHALFDGVNEAGGQRGLTCPEAAARLTAPDVERARRRTLMPIPAMKAYASLETLPEERIGDRITRKILVRKA